MSIEWEHCRVSGVKHSNRWGHSSCTLPNNQLMIFGGYADSKYFNDAWIFNPTKKTWNKVVLDQNSRIPAERSNCSLFYCQIHECILMYGGGAAQGVRFNDIWTLKLSFNRVSNAYEGSWEQIQSFSDKIPWGRTYHVSEVYQQYLLIQGGQSYSGQIQDFWGLDLSSLCWVELKSSLKMKARKFHTSAIVKDVFYVFGGIFGNYEPINQILCTNLSILKTISIEEVKDYDFAWKQVDIKINESISMGRWGHLSKVYEDKVFIFGGRTSADQNDLVVFDPMDDSLRKVDVCKSPQGRRKACAWMIGSYLIINSGYNGKYLSDQYWINLRFVSCSKKYGIISQCSKMKIKKQACDIHINTADNKYVDIFTKFVKSSFQSEEHMITFLEQLGQMNQAEAQKFVQILTNGVYLNRIQGEKQTNDEETVYSKAGISYSLKQHSLQINESLLKKYKITYSSNGLLANKKKILFNVVKENLVMNLNPFKLIRVSDQQFMRLFDVIQKDFCCDLKINFTSNKQTKLSDKDKLPIKQLLCCRYPLTARSEYFKHLLARFQNSSKVNRLNSIVQVHLQADQVILKVIILYCYYGHVIVPKCFTLDQCINLYSKGKQFVMKDVVNIVFQEFKQMMASTTTQNGISAMIQKRNNAKRQSANKKFEVATNPSRCSQQNPQKNLDKTGDQVCIYDLSKIMRFCLKEVQSTSDHTKNPYTLRFNKWHQLLEYLINKLSQISIKRHVSSQKVNKSQSKVMKNKQMAMGKSYLLHDNSENKENCSKNYIQNNELLTKKEKTLTSQQAQKENAGVQIIMQRQIQTGQDTLTNNQKTKLKQSRRSSTSVKSFRSSIPYVSIALLMIQQEIISQLTSGIKGPSKPIFQLCQMANSNQHCKQLKQNLPFILNLIDKQKELNLFKNQYLMSQLRTN